ncbi:NAD(P)H-hydrate dehydratase [Marinobacter nauticus]
MPTQTTHSLPEALYSADAVRAMDEYLINEQGVDGFELMQSAARAAFRQLLRLSPPPESILVLCGAGNNGGDGYLVAANALRHGMNVQCVAVAPVEKLSGDALKAANKARAEGVEIQVLADLAESELETKLGSVAVIVDAMLGTGVTGAPREPVASVICAVNASGVPVLAVDLPSGLNANTGAAEGDVIQAALTVTFIGAKAGLYTGQGVGACGRVVFESLSTEAHGVGDQQQAIAGLYRWSACQSWLPQRALNAHKGSFGHVLVVAGDHGYGGAGLMAAEAAARSGAGLVSLATREEHVSAALARCPSVMVRGVSHGNDLTPLLEKADVVICGPGLGQSAWGQQLLQAVMGSGKPRVLDADALNLMAGQAPSVYDRQVLTPHPGEAARLLGCQVADVEADRLAAAKKLQQMFGGVVLLKGAGTVVAAGTGVPAIIAGGNPGMATGGMGDVLSGMVGALVAQMHSLEKATIAAACAHLAAADQAAQSQGYMGLLPVDVIEALAGVFYSVQPVIASNRREGE